MGRSAPRATAPPSASWTRRASSVDTSPTGHGAVRLQPAVVRRATQIHRLRGSTLQSAWAARLGAKRTLSPFQQSAEEAGRLGWFGGFDGFQFGLGLCLPFAKLAAEPFVEAHASLCGALGFVGKLAFGKCFGGECLGRWHVGSPCFGCLFAGSAAWIKRDQRVLSQGRLPPAPPRGTWQSLARCWATSSNTTFPKLRGICWINPISLWSATLAGWKRRISRLERCYLPDGTLNTTGTTLSVKFAVFSFCMLFGIQMRNPPAMG